MPHMPDYTCTPPKGGGGGKTLYIVLTVIIVLAALKLEHFLAEYGIYVLIAIGLATGAIAARFAYRAYTELKARTWRMEDASVMSKYEAERQIYYGGRYPRHPLDGGPYIKGEVIEGDVNSAYPRAITEGHGKRATGLPRGEEGTRSGSQRSGPPRRRQSTWPALRQDTGEERPEQ
jgi:hypothetical protein